MLRDAFYNNKDLWIYDHLNHYKINSIWTTTKIHDFQRYSVQAQKLYQCYVSKLDISRCYNSMDPTDRKIIMPNLESLSWQVSKLIMKNQMHTHKHTCTVIYEMKRDWDFEQVLVVSVVNIILVELVSFCRIQLHHLQLGDLESALPHGVENFIHVWNAIRLYNSQCPEHMLHEITEQSSAPINENDTIQ